MSARLTQLTATVLLKFGDPVHGLLTPSSSTAIAR
jgi:hypothetical protein